MTVVQLSSVSVLTDPAAPADRVAAALLVAPTESSALRLGPVQWALRGADAAHESLAGPDLAAAVDLALDRHGAAVVVLAGDDDETVRAALAAARRGVPLARIGAGLRCGDRGVPAEVNRVVLDELADLLFVDGPESGDQLAAEGVEPAAVHCVGSTIADVVARSADEARARRAWAARGLHAGRYVLVSLTDTRALGEPDRLAALAGALEALTARALPVLDLPTPALEELAATGCLNRLRRAGAVVVREPAHLDRLSLETAAAVVVTDSADVQEETTVLGVPCCTLGRSTERRLTLTAGTNHLVDDPRDLPAAVAALAGEPIHAPEPIEYWDGHAGARIARHLLAPGLIAA